MELAKEFEVGMTYLLETEKDAPPFEVFRSLTEDRPGLCITKKTPAHIKENYDLEGVKFGRLSTSDDRATIGPKELDILGLTIKRFLSEESGVVLLDSMDYLISNNDSSEIIRFIQTIQDRITGGSSTFLVVLNTSELDEEDVQLLRNGLDLELKSLKESTEEKEETPISEDGEDLVSQVRSMMEFLKEQEHYIEVEEDKLEQSGTSKASYIKELESLKDEIEALREENRDLKNELERIKTEGEEEGKDEVFDEEIVDEVVATVEEEKRDIEEQMGKIEDEEKKSEQDESSKALMRTLHNLEDEVGSLRNELKTIKKESPKKEMENAIETEDIEKESEEKSDLIDSEISSEASSEDDFEVFEVIQEPRLEDEYLAEEEVETAEEESPIETQKEKVDEGIIYDENKIILKADSKIAEDIESDGTIEVQKGVAFKGSLKSEEDIIVDENTTIHGEITSKSGDVQIGKDCKITGEISGKVVSISERSKVDDINAKEEVMLENNTRVRNILCQQDVRIFENVEIDGGIDYGGQLNLNGEYINIRGRIRPVDKEEEVVKEKWV